ncbi:MAG: type II toxin-antitoxin system VapC family toxin [Thaumarchaeota archaeon]|nr:type II toxin-antitoxin system VapC family toxin [Nitrososphaerota archaeon]
MIFDASSVYITIKNKDLQALKNSSTLDLAFYEIGNAIVQEVRMGIIDQKASAALSQILQSLPYVMNVERFQTLKAEKIQEIAKQSSLTFYDASYIALVKGNDDEALTTDDSFLAKAARKMGVRTFSASDG